jgi:hypothetical protein
MRVDLIETPWRIRLDRSEDSAEAPVRRAAGIDGDQAPATDARAGAMERAC